ncbi:response regulator [Pseudopedobacter beijingensis]|uniref:Response regulator n=1 Tax=Pseudopedobacter beijingensis TaxID=1207056 RepID=A0ABW4I963_9SPHI
MTNEVLNILIIDDDEINNFIAAKLIDKIHPVAHISICLNGKEGIDFLASRIHKEEELPDIVFLDINMPVMNGWEFLEEFEKIKNSIKKRIMINMLSSSVYNDDITKSQTFTTVNKFISKPLTTDKIKDLYNSLGY